MVPRGVSEEGTDAAAEFERELFKRGTLEFDFDQYLAEREHLLVYSGKKLKEEGWKPDFAARIIEGIGDETTHYHVWQSHFSGQVPEDWKSWTLTWGAFRRAGELGFQLSSPLVDAGVSYPASLVAIEAGETQRLNETQLAILLARPDLYDYQREAVLAAQMEMGVSEEVIHEATRIAKETQDRIREKKREKPKIEGPQTFE
jgi:hypothetical protein